MLLSFKSPKSIFLLLVIFFSIPCLGQGVKRVACVGNSITFGYGIHPREKSSYPAQLQSMLGDGYDVRNFGVSGRTLLRHGNHPYWKEKAFHEAIAFQPDVVFIMLGTNDSKAVNRPFFNEFEKDYSDLIDSFRALPTHPRVIMILPVATFNQDSTSIYDPVIVQRIIPMCESVAYKKKVEMINLHPMFLDRQDELFDKIHPNAIGDKHIAQRLYEQLQITPARNSHFFDKITTSTKITNYHGYQCVEFKLEGRDCKIVRPYTLAKGNPWIWRARFWGNQPQAEIGLLERGFYLAYCDVAELYGNKKCIDIWNKFYAFIHLQLGLNAKVALEGYSRGGIYVYNWAAANPQKVACVYADAPVLEFKSWPGGKGIGAGSKSDWALFKKDYGISSESGALQFKGAPLYRTNEIVGGHYPMLHVVGDADSIVPVSENTAPFVKKIRSMGGNIEVIHKPGMFHHPHSLADPERIINFILRATGQKVNLATVAAPGVEFRSTAAGWADKTTWYDQAENIQHALDSSGQVDLLFMGNSITQGIGLRSLVKYRPGEKAFLTQFKNLKLATAAIAGDRIQNLAWRVEHYNYNVCQPKVVVITIGVNNFLGDYSPEEMISGIEKLVQTVDKKMPQAQILLTGPLPAGYTEKSDYRNKYDQVHKGIQFLAKNKKVRLYRYNDKMLLPDNKLNPDFYGNGDIHLTEAGYRQWAAYIYKQIKMDGLL